MVDTPIVSESLQKTFRENFPSQVDSGRDLHVSDVVLPIVDFSTVAGVTGLDTSLQQALAFGNQTSFDIDSGSTTDIITTTGFFRVIGVANMTMGGPNDTLGFILSDGSTDKVIWRMESLVGGASNTLAYLQFDFNVFLKAGDIFKGVRSNTSSSSLVGSTRQIADISGTLVNPSGYTGE